MGMNPKAADRKASFARSAFDNYGKELHRFLMRRLRHVQDAADLSQEVYLRLTRLESTDWVRKPRAYVYGVASHVVAEFRMRSERDPVTFDSEVVEHLAEEPVEMSSGDFTDQLSTQRQLERVLAQLPPTHLAVLLLHKREGLSYEEVAEKLGLSLHTVQKYVFQAKAQIRMNWDQG